MFNLATVEDPLVGTTSLVVSSLMADVESSDDEEIFYEEMVHSYKVMYEKLAEALTKNQDLRKQVSQLCNEKEELIKHNNMLWDKVCHQEETLHELEQMKKTMCMLNFGTMTLDQILEMGKRD